MVAAYPIVQILFYLVMCFAPPEVNRATITGPDESFVLTRVSGEWRFTGKEISGFALLKNGNALFTANGESSELPGAPFLSAAIGHDWAKQPKVTLQEQNTLEKTPDGFLVRTDDGKAGMKAYRVTFQTPQKPGGGPSINVLGAVKQPGVYQAGALVPMIVSAAGGLTEEVDRVECRILRGQGGMIPQIIAVPSEAILDQAAGGPKLEDHDTLHIRMKTDAAPPGASERLTITLAADGTLTVANQPCPADQLKDRLAKLAAKKPLSILLRCDKTLSAREIVATLDACKAAGISNVSLATP